MKLQPYSFDGTSLNSSAYAAEFLNQSESIQAGADPKLVERAHTAPSLGYVEYRERYLIMRIRMLGSAWSQTDTLNKLFLVGSQTKRTLIAQDLNDSNKQWETDVTVLSATVVPGMRRQMVVVLLQDDPHWYLTSEVTTNWSVTASGQTQAITPGGNVACLPVYKLTPTSARPVNRGFQFRQFYPIYNPVARAYEQYPYDVTDGGLNTAALILAGEMQADGDDLRVFVDGVERDRWLGSGSYAIDTTTTTVWVNLSLLPRIELTLGTAIAGAGAITEIAFEDTTANRDALARLPRNRVLMIDSELFQYRGVSEDGLKVTGVTREAKGSSAAAHTVGTTVRWIEHDVWIMYGDSSLTAPSQNDAVKPILDLSSSTNTSWVYTEFTDDDEKRTGRWQAAVMGGNGPKTGTYSGNRGADADPATEAGMRVKAYQRLSGVWGADNGHIVWQWAHAGGATNISHSGEKYRVGSAWPDVIFEKANGRVWTEVRSEATPASASTWTAWGTHADALGGTYRKLRWRMQGACAAGQGSQTLSELETATITLNSSNVPQGSSVTRISSYHLRCRLQNDTSGEYLDIDFMMELNQTLEIDTLNKTVSYLKDNSRQDAAIKFSSKRFDWLALAAGVENTLSFTDANTGNVTVSIVREDRNT